MGPSAAELDGDKSMAGSDSHNNTCADDENRAQIKTAGHAEGGPAVDPVGRGNDRMVAGSHYCLPERRDLGQ